MIWGDQSPLRQDRLVQAAKAILRDAGIDPPHYSGHSLRIGAASTAAARGVHPGPLDQDAGSMVVRGLPAICQHPCCYVISASCGRSGAHVAIGHMNRSSKLFTMLHYVQLVLRFNGLYCVYVFRPPYHFSVFCCRIVVALMILVIPWPPIPP